MKIYFFNNRINSFIFLYYLFIYIYLYYMFRQITDTEILAQLVPRGNLAGADLEGADLEGVNLEGANLEGVNCQDANLEGTNFQDANLEGTNFEGANLANANFVNAQINNDTRFTINNLSEEQIRQLGLQLARSPVQARPPSIVIEGRLKELCDIIQVFDFIEYGDIPATTFFENHADDIPFIVVNDRDDGATYSGNALNWNTGNKEFVECADDAPQTWQGNSYGRLIKPNGRQFIKVFVNGAGLLVLKPDWYDSKVVPGIRFFRLVESNPVFKYMSLDLATQNIAPDFSALGADHCNQLNPQKSYYLDEINLEQLNDMVPQGGSKRQTKRRKGRKGQTKRRKGRKGHTKSRK